MSEASEQVLDVGGVRLHAACEGEGASLLVLHGFTGDRESMSGISNDLCADHRVMRLELIGHGASDSPSDPSLYSMQSCAMQIAEAARVLSKDPPHLLGYSMGGRAALASVIASPESFASLILVGATAGIADPAMRAARVREDLELADRIESEGIEAFVDEWMAKPIFASQERLGAIALAGARAQRLRNDPSGLANSLRGMGAGAQQPLHDQLEKLELPVLLVVGEEDAKFLRVAADLGRALPQARVAHIPEAGHAAHLEAPALFARLTREFIAEQTGG